MSWLPCSFLVISSGCLSARARLAGGTSPCIFFLWNLLAPVPISCNFLGMSQLPWPFNTICVVCLCSRARFSWREFCLFICWECLSSRGRFLSFPCYVSAPTKTLPLLQTDPGCSRWFLGGCVHGCVDGVYTRGGAEFEKDTPCCSCSSVAVQLRFSCAAAPCDSDTIRTRGLIHPTEIAENEHGG